MLNQTISQILAALTVLSQIVITLGALIFISPRNKIRSYLFKSVNKQALPLVFIISAVATSGSLFYSEIAGYIPCELCWYQRIFMYPQVFISALALYKKDSKALRYNLLLSLIGSAIAFYHSYITYWGKSINTCSAVPGVSCLRRYVFEFGYITIPLMALTAFILIIWVTAIKLKSNQ